VKVERDGWDSEIDALSFFVFVFFTYIPTEIEILLKCVYKVQSKI
jgi:hypothetical protein